MQHYVVDLECTRCRTERRHFLTYLGNVFASAVCTCCGETFRPPSEVLIAEYVRDFERRLIRKPGRMLGHARAHPLIFMFSYLPRGLVCKPREVLAEWGTLARSQQESRRSTATR